MNAEPMRTRFAAPGFPVLWVNFNKVDDDAICEGTSQKVCSEYCWCNGLPKPEDSERFRRVRSG